MILLLKRGVLKKKRDELLWSKAKQTGGLNMLIEKFMCIYIYSFVENKQ